MFLKLVKTGQIEVEGRTFAMRYYERRTGRGARRATCAGLRGANARIIIDDDNMSSLESRVERVAPALVYSRVLTRAS